MHLPPVRYVTRIGHLFVLWALLVALPIHGGAGVLLQIVGPVHRHLSAGVAAPQAAANPLGRGAAWLVGQWRAWQHAAHAEAHAAFLFVHGQRHEDEHEHGHQNQDEHQNQNQNQHQHAGFERHHHDPDDGVMALGLQETGSATAADLSPAAGVGGASLPLGLAASLIVPLPPLLVGKRRWGRAGPVVWRSADLRRRDRPPRTP